MLKEFWREPRWFPDSSQRLSFLSAHVVTDAFSQSRARLCGRHPDVRLTAPPQHVQSRPVVWWHEGAALPVSSLRKWHLLFTIVKTVCTRNALMRILHRQPNGWHWYRGEEAQKRVCQSHRESALWNWVGVCLGCCRDQKGWHACTVLRNRNQTEWIHSLSVWPGTRELSCSWFSFSRKWAGESAEGSTQGTDTKLPGGCTS